MCALTHTYLCEPYADGLVRNPSKDDVCLDDGADGIYSWLYACDASNQNQHWSFSQARTGALMKAASKPGMCLQPEAPGDGSKLVLASCNTAGDPGSQAWTLIQVDGDCFIVWLFGCPWGSGGEEVSKAAGSDMSAALSLPPALRR